MAALLALLLAAIWILGVVVWRQRRLLQVLTIESRHDLLTGLPNRRALQAHWNDHSEASSLILVDLIDFKNVNDCYNHAVGDLLLREVGMRIAASVSPPGFLARWGGDEFAILLPGPEVTSWLQQLQSLLATPFDLSSNGGPDQFKIGARIGVSNRAPTLIDAERVAAIALADAKSDKAQNRAVL